MADNLARKIEEKALEEADIKQSLSEPILKILPQNLTPESAAEATKAVSEQIERTIGDSAKAQLQQYIDNINQNVGNDNKLEDAIDTIGNEDQPDINESGSANDNVRENLPKNPTKKTNNSKTKNPNDTDEPNKNKTDEKPEIEQTPPEENKINNEAPDSKKEDEENLGLGETPQETDETPKKEEENDNGDKDEQEESDDDEEDEDLSPEKNMATQAFNRIRNRKKIAEIDKKIDETSERIKVYQNLINKKNKEKKQFENEIKPLEIYKKLLTAANITILIGQIVIGILAFIFMITIFLIFIAMFLFGVSGSMNYLKAMNKLQIRTLNEKIKPIKEKIDKIEKDIKSLQTNIKRFSNEQRQLGIQKSQLINQGLLQKGPEANN